MKTRVNAKIDCVPATYRWDKPLIIPGCFQLPSTGRIARKGVLFYIVGARSCFLIRILSRIPRSCKIGPHLLLIAKQ